MLHKLGVRPVTEQVPLPPPPRCPQIIGAGMLRALEQVHGEGFIHRDVKPANFVMAPPDAQDPLRGGRAGGWPRC